MPSKRTLASTFSRWTSGSRMSSPRSIPKRAPPSVIAVLFVVYALLVYALLWVFRRFGFLALLAAWLTYAFGNTVLPSFTDWYAGGFLVSAGITVALAGAALWVILSQTSTSDSFVDQP